MDEFTKKDAHQVNFRCECGSKIMETINDEHPHGLSALNDDYDYLCYSCKKLVKSSNYTAERDHEGHLIRPLTKS